LGNASSFVLCTCAQFLFVYNFVKTLHRNYTKRELEEYDKLHQNAEGLGINLETNLDGGEVSKLDG